MIQNLRNWFKRENYERLDVVQELFNDIGVTVELTDTKLVLVPSPVRILLQVDDSEKIEVWRPN